MSSRGHEAHNADKHTHTQHTKWTSKRRAHASTAHQSGGSEGHEEFNREADGDPHSKEDRSFQREVSQQTHTCTKRKTGALCHHFVLTRRNSENHRHECSLCISVFISRFFPLLSFRFTHRHNLKCPHPTHTHTNLFTENATHGHSYTRKPHLLGVSGGVMSV